MKFPELNEQGNQDALHLIERFKAKLQSCAEETIGEVYCNLLPHIETDTWTNYREECRLSLQNHYCQKETATSEEAWAKLIRQAIYEQFKPELQNAIIRDLEKKIADLLGWQSRRF